MSSYLKKGKTVEMDKIPAVPEPELEEDVYDYSHLVSDTSGVWFVWGDKHRKNGPSTTQESSPKETN